jgi:hypothetical protein
MSKLPSLYEIRNRNTNQIPSLVIKSGPLGKHMFKGAVSKKVDKFVPETALVVSNDRWRDREN